MRIYISGKITGNKNYLEQFKIAENWLRDNNYIPINPAEAFNPSLEKYLTYDELMQLDIELLKMADGILMLYGWQNSKGAIYEHLTAQLLNKKILYQVCLYNN